MGLTRPLRASPTVRPYPHRLKSRSLEGVPGSPGNQFNRLYGNFLFGQKSDKSTNQQNPQKRKNKFLLFSRYFPYVLSGFPLVSDGPMVRDLCN